MNLQNEDWLEAEECFNSIKHNKQVGPRSLVRISEVPSAMRKKDEDYYVPKVISIGPYHYGDTDLVRGENLKAFCTTRLLSNAETRKNLYKKLRERAMVEHLRGFYVKHSTEKLCDKVFTRMMLQDGCFILYYIKNFLPRSDSSGELNLNSQDVEFVYQDLLLLENQIPFIVLNEVANISEVGMLKDLIYRFFDHSSILETGVRVDLSFIFGGVTLPYNHLFRCWHVAVTRRFGLLHGQPAGLSPAIRTVNELMDAGIHFKPSNTKALSGVSFFSRWWSCSSTLKLPPITVDDSTKMTLLNLLAYEMSSVEAIPVSPVVTSYVRVLRYLINQPEDVNALREAGVLHHHLGSDEEIVKLLKEIGTYLMPEYDSTYLDVMYDIEDHYERFRKFNNPISQFKRQYFKSPWAFLALAGGVLALFFSAVQTYFTVWSPKGECDDLCQFLKENHRL